MQSQLDRILNGLRKKNYLTSLDFISNMGNPILRYSARVSELRNIGYKITCDLYKNKKTNARFGIYYFSEKKFKIKNNDWIKL